MAKQFLSIKVMQKHIRDGEAGDTNMCPIALAVKDALDKEDFIYEDSDAGIRVGATIDISAEKETGYLTQQLNVQNFSLQKAAAFVVDFDRLAELEDELAEACDGRYCDDPDCKRTRVSLKKQIAALKAKVQPFEFQIPLE